jgi:nondiscriminating glutamyl-tRNA synthetase
MTVRVRFAPSPTGWLHIGNARTALFNWLYARHTGGTFIFRIEDTDKERSTQESEQSIIEDLRWLGLQWDEGMVVGGQYGPYRQSERTQIYEEHRDRLLADGNAYRCYCTVEELEAMKEAQKANKQPPHYPGKCRSLTPEQRKQFEAEGRTSVVRLKIDPEDIRINDLVRGEVVFKSDSLGGDFILFRSDGGVMFNFAVVIDDATMKVTHVLRGEDHLTNTAKQLLLYKAFGYEPPAFGHMAMILGPDKAKLSKRHGTVSVRQFKDEGYLPEALFNYMTLLGWSPGDDREKMTVEEIVRDFKLERLLKAASIFDFKKLRWMNANYIKELPPEKLMDAVKPYIPEFDALEAKWGKAWLQEVIWIFHDNLEVLADIRDKVLAIAELNPTDEGQKVFAEAESKSVLAAFREEISNVPEVTEAVLEKILADLQAKTGAKGKKLFFPLRSMMIGSPHGPDIRKVGPLLGKEELIKRATVALGS